LPNWQQLVNALIEAQGCTPTPHPSGLDDLSTFNYIKAQHQTSLSVEESMTSFQDDADVTKKALDGLPATAGGVQVKDEHPKFNAFINKIPALTKALKVAEKDLAFLKQQMAVLKVSKKAGAKELAEQLAPGVAALADHAEELMQFVCLSETLIANDITETEIDTHESTIAMYDIRTAQFLEAIKGSRKKVKLVMEQ
jgi:hypothetical protein